MTRVEQLKKAINKAQNRLDDIEVEIEDLQWERDRLEGSLADLEDELDEAIEDARLEAEGSPRDSVDIAQLTLLH